MPSTAEYLAANVNPVEGMKAGNDYANAIFNRAAQVKAGGQYGTGDYAGASQTLANAGDIQGASAVQNEGAGRNAAGIKYISSALPVFQRILQVHAAEGPEAQGAALAGAFDHIAPEAKQVAGVSDQTLAGLRQALVSDPQGTIQRLQASIPVEVTTIGDTGFVRQGANVLGSLVGQKVVEQKPGETLQTITPGYVPSGGQPPVSPQQAPQSAQGGSNALFGSQAPQPSAVAQVESGGNPNAVSPKGATGTMQTMPGTLADPGFGVTPAQNNSPEEQTRVGNDYLAALNNHYGNPAIALIANNWGPGNTDKWIASGGDFNKLPQETKEYLGKVAVQQAMQQRGGQQPSGQTAPQGGQDNVPGSMHVVSQGVPPQEIPLSDADLKRFNALPGSTKNSVTGAITRATATNSMPNYSPDDLKTAAYEQLQNGGKPLQGRDPETNRLVSRTMNAPASQGGLRPDSVSPEDWAYLVANAGISKTARQQAATLLSKQQALTAANEGTVNNSIKILQNLLPTAASKGQFTAVNEFEQYLARQSNNPGAINLKNAIDSISAEYARVMTGSTSGAPSSDSSRREAAERILTGYNQGALPSVLSQMQAEMRGRSASQTAGLEALTGGQFGGVPTTGGPTGGGQTIIRYDAHGNRIP